MSKAYEWIFKRKPNSRFTKKKKMQQNILLITAQPTEAIESADNFLTIMTS